MDKVEKKLNFLKDMIEPLYKNGHISSRKASKINEILFEVYKHYSEIKSQNLALYGDLIYKGEYEMNKELFQMFEKALGVLMLFGVGEEAFKSIRLETIEWMLKQKSLKGAMTWERIFNIQSALLLYQFEEGKIPENYKKLLTLVKKIKQ